MNGLAQLLDSRNELKPILDRLVEEARQQVSQSSKSPSFGAFYGQGLDILVNKHCDLVFGTVTSPIERIWMNSLQVQFLLDANMLVVTPPIPDVEKWRREMIFAIEHAQHVLERIHESGHSIGEIDTYLDDEVNAGRLSPKDRDLHYFWLMEYGVLPFRHAHHLTLQAGFPKKGIRTRDARVDALIWHPDDPGISVIVECDGYAFHSDKRSFANDRQRDRLFVREGHTVMRFSGAEILADPALAVRDLYTYLGDRK
jgi:hypothetical protein